MTLFHVFIIFGSFLFGFINVKRDIMSNKWLIKDSLANGAFFKVRKDFVLILVIELPFVSLI